jgi:RimJ/RimL family protein N-acetyltransferase
VRHDLSAKGVVFGLRPVGLDDADFMVRLRGDAARARFINRGATSVEAQRNWITDYLDRAGDYCFVIHRMDDGAPEGMVGLYDVQETTRSAEWGRWVLQPGSMAAVESAMLVYQLGFERLRLASIHCRTASANAHVVSFHDSCGLARTDAGLFVEIDGERVPAIEHRLSADRWPDVKRRLEPMARRFARARARRQG